MTSKIKIRRGTQGQLPPLELAEPGFTTDTKELYIGDGVSNIKVDTDNFNDLVDTPETYVGQEGKYPRVNASGTAIEYDYLEFDIESPEAPLIPETAISGTYLVNFEGGRLLVGATGNKPDLVYLGPVAGLAFNDKSTESCYGSFKVPPSWNTESDVEFTINFMNDVAQTGDTSVAWALDYHTYEPGNVYGDKITTTEQIEFELPTDCAAGTFHSYTMLIASNDINNHIEKNHIMTFQFYREGANAVDTAKGDAVLLTLMVEMKTGQHVVGDA